MLDQIFNSLENVKEKGFKYVDIAKNFDVSINDIESDTIVPDHTHDQDVYNFVFEGTFKVNIEGTEKYFEKGDWIFIKANTVHSVETKNQVKLLELWEK